MISKRGPERYAEVRGTHFNTNKVLPLAEEEAQAEQNKAALFTILLSSTSE
jgi:hypothetical protein